MRYGYWSTEHGSPVFVYDADQRALPEAEWDPITIPYTRQHWVMLGNRRIQLFAANDGGLGLFDESYGLRWLTAPDPGGTGISIVEEHGASHWGTAEALWPSDNVPVRTFGPTSFIIDVQHQGLALKRTVLCPEGEVPWVLIRVQLVNVGEAPRRIRHREQWVIRPRFLNLGGTPQTRAALARSRVRFRIETDADTIRAAELRTDVTADATGMPEIPELSGMAAAFQHIFGPEVVLQLQALLGGDGQAYVVGDVEPVLEYHTDLVLAVGETRELWFRFGIDDETTVEDPTALYAAALEGSAERLPQAKAPQAPEATWEVPWHAALLTGGACRDKVIGGHTLDQGSGYSFAMGFNGAARDPLQHALPLVYAEPDLALSVLRNTCAWATPRGEMIFGLDGAKQPWTTMFQPSDQNLWVFWLAAEYLAATGDLGAFDAMLDYHPHYAAPPVPLREHLRRQMCFFLDEIGRGTHGHIRIRNADWNDMAVIDSGVERAVMIAEGESVLNSAMAAWVLPVFAGLCARLGETEMEQEARSVAEELREVVANAWNGRWFDRAYAPGGRTIGGPEDMWLEVQPWALLCGAVDNTRARQLLATIDAGPRAGSPNGARARWPVPSEGSIRSMPGEGTSGGGIWYAINMTLIWAAVRINPELAWDEWRRMTLTAHTAAYAAVWEGTLSGPDCFNAPESPRPGRTWASPQIGGMQAFPVNNLNSHSQPLLSYLRLLGVEPTPRGTLKVGQGASWESKTFQLGMNGHGRLLARGPIVLETIHGIVRGGPGWITW